MHLRRSSDGWLHTGDLARIDEARFVQIVDRLKDMVCRGGEKVGAVVVPVPGAEAHRCREIPRARY